MLHFPGKELVHRQGHLRSAGGSSHLVQAGQHGHGHGQNGHGHSGGGGVVGHHHHHTQRRALPPAPVLPQSLRPVAPSIQHYNSSGNSSTTSSNSYYQTKQSSSTGTSGTGGSPDSVVAATSSYVDQLVKRSASSVNAKNRAPIAKPVRRSKSQRVVNPMQNFVTSIQHGGSVTLVSLNGDPNHSGSNSNSTSESEIKHVHHHHFVQGWDQNPGGLPVQVHQAGVGQVQQQQIQHHQGMSQTLPRKGSKKVDVKPSAHDDSDVVIKKQGLNGVKIRLNLNQIESQQSDLNSPPQSYSDRSGSGDSNSSKDIDIDLDHNLDHSPPPPVTLDLVDSEVSDHYYLNSGGGNNQNKKRKYTLEELEVEGIATPTEESLSDASGTKSSEFEEEEVDLNSLIEGDVDEDDDDMPTPLGKDQSY